jgi:hypothetical protein
MNSETYFRKFVSVTTTNILTLIFTKLKIIVYQCDLSRWFKSVLEVHYRQPPGQDIPHLPNNSTAPPTPHTFFALATKE